MATQRIYHSPYPAPFVPTDISLPEFLLQTNPDNVPADTLILEDFDKPGRAITYGELRQQAAIQAAVLRQQYGVQHGDVVGLFGSNSVDWALLCLAVLWAGGTFCAMNPLATSHELVHYLTLAKPKFIFTDPELTTKLQPAVQKLTPSFPPSQVPGIANIATISELASTTPVPTPLTPPTFRNLDNRTIPAGIIFSSGTSGAPKAVLLSHHGLIGGLLTSRATNPFINNAYTREVFFPSFAHIYGIVCGVFLPAWTGGYVVAMRKFDFAGYVARSADIKATLMRLVPATAARLASGGEDVTKLDLGGVRTVLCSGASLHVETIAGMRRVLHPEVVVLNGYGMSEGTISLQREGRAWKAGSIGRPAAGVEVRIVADDGSDAGADGDGVAEGECYFRSPTAFIGYKNNPEETAKTLNSEGWLCTGDVVKIDRDGDMWLTGRKKELIKYKGNQVAPAEVEGILLEHEDVADAGVCGLVRDGEELPAACVVLAKLQADERTTDEVLQQVREFLHERIAPYKKLRGGIYAVDELPRGSGGKLLRRSLPEVIAAVGKVRAKL